MWSPAAGLLALAVAASMAGCGTPEQQRPQGFIQRPAHVWTLAELKDGIFQNAGNWASLKASCALTVRGPAVQGENNQRSYRKGTLWLSKPEAKEKEAPLVLLRLEFGEGGRDLLVVGDGRRYAVYAPGLNKEGFVGAYGALSRSAVLPLRPEDIADALEPAGVLWNQIQILKQEGPVLEILSMEVGAKRNPADPAQPRVAALGLVSNLILKKIDQKPHYVLKYDENGFPLVDVKMLRFQSTEGANKAPTSLADQFWIGYPEQGTEMLIELSNLALNVPVPLKSFKLPTSD